MKRLELNPTQVKGTWSRVRMYGVHTMYIRIPGTVVVPGTSERQLILEQGDVRKNF